MENRLKIVLKIRINLDESRDENESRDCMKTKGKKVCGDFCPE